MTATAKKKRGQRSRLVIRRSELRNRARSGIESPLSPPIRKRLRRHLAYVTRKGVAAIGDSHGLLKGELGRALKGKVQLIFTSPPFPLNRKKAYDNKQGDAYKAWLKNFAPTLRDLLTPDGSIVVEVGNAWEPGVPVMSTLALESLLAFKEAGGFHLCQEFIWYNPAKLPTPAQWVTIERIRVKDAFTRLWWLSPTEYPFADNRGVLQPYSNAMLSLLRTGKYNSGMRPSHHDIGTDSFLTDNGGAIPPSVIAQESEHFYLPESVLVGSNTSSSDSYQKFCRDLGIEPHPARMPLALAEFFIKLCTRLGDLVFDPFAGSNTTGAAAERLGRSWVTIEALEAYALAGRGRFTYANPEVIRRTKEKLAALS